MPLRKYANGNDAWNDESERNFFDKLKTCDKTTMQLPKRFITTVPGSSKQRARRSMRAFL